MMIRPPSARTPSSCFPKTVSECERLSPNIRQQLKLWQRFIDTYLQKAGMDSEVATNMGWFIDSYGVNYRALNISQKVIE
jgi:hypothetical protein